MSSMPHEPASVTPRRRAAHPASGSSLPGSPPVLMRLPNLDPLAMSPGVDGACQGAGNNETAEPERAEGGQFQHFHAAHATAPPAGPAAKRLSSRGPAADDERPLPLDGLDAGWMSGGGKVAVAICLAALLATVYVVVTGQNESARTVERTKPADERLAQQVPLAVPSSTRSPDRTGVPESTASRWAPADVEEPTSRTSSADQEPSQPRGPLAPPVPHWDVPTGGPTLDAPRAPERSASVPSRHAADDDDGPQVGWIDDPYGQRQPEASVARGGFLRPRSDASAGAELDAEAANYAEATGYPIDDPTGGPYGSSPWDTPADAGQSPWSIAPQPWDQFGAARPAAESSGSYPHARAAGERPEDEGRSTPRLAQQPLEPPPAWSRSGQPESHPAAESRDPFGRDYRGNHERTESGVYQGLR